MNFINCGAFIMGKGKLQFGFTLENLQTVQATLLFSLMKHI